MTVIVAGMLTDSFGKGANDATLQRVLWQLREQQENTKKNNPAQQRNAKTESVSDFAVSIIGVEQAEQFQSEIDIFQEASVEAIMAYDVEIEHADAEIKQMLSQAHVLEDGRRVFKTEDGLRVFDEHGSELDKEIIHPDEIGNDKPRWERFRSTEDSLKRLRLERGQTVEFQSRLDEAQEHLDSGKMTQDQFEELREQLYLDAPDAVRELASQRGLGLIAKKTQKHLRLLVCWKLISTVNLPLCPALFPVSANGINNHPKCYKAFQKVNSII